MAVIRVLKNGPLRLDGDIELKTARGETIEPQLREGRLFLCRCGQSANKPFCDGAHLFKGFCDESPSERSAEAEEAVEGVLDR